MGDSCRDAKQVAVCLGPETSGNNLAFRLIETIVKVPIFEEDFDAFYAAAMTGDRVNETGNR